MVTSIAHGASTAGAGLDVMSRAQALVADTSSPDSLATLFQRHLLIFHTFSKAVPPMAAGHAVPGSLALVWWVLVSHQFLPPDVEDAGG